MTFEQLKEDPDKLELLKECDVLVDGPFIMAQRDTTLAFRGSKNQRLVDVQKSLLKGEVVEYGKHN
jgi:anaerobic ribonucleoside-triphosphate reductase activating protein